MIISNPSIPPVVNSTTAQATALAEVSRLLGIGGAAQAWDAAFDAVDLANGASLASRTTLAAWTYNAVYKSAAWKRITSDASVRIQLEYTGNITIATAPAGTAGGTITFTTRCTISQNGRVVWTQSSASGYTRVGANENRLDTWGSYTVLTEGANVIAAPDSNALWVDIAVQAYVKSSGTAGPVVLTSSWYNDSGHTNFVGSVEAYAYEVTGTPSLQLLSRNDTEIRVPLASRGGSVYVQAAGITGTNNVINTIITGYGD